MVKAVASVVYEVAVEFEDDGETELRSQAYDAVLDSAPMGDIIDVIIEDIEGE